MLYNFSDLRMEFEKLLKNLTGDENFMDILDELKELTINGSNKINLVAS